MNQTPYRRLVQYYETDRMGIVHHSNYIRWFEEARTDFLRNNGIVYSDLEQSGVMIPVVNVSCRFRTPARYDEWIGDHHHPHRLQRRAARLFLRSPECVRQAPRHRDERALLHGRAALGPHQHETQTA